LRFLWLGPDGASLLRHWYNERRLAADYNFPFDNSVSWFADHNVGDRTLISRVVVQLLLGVGTVLVSRPGANMVFGPCAWIPVDRSTP